MVLVQFHLAKKMPSSKVQPSQFALQTKGLKNKRQQQSDEHHSVMWCLRGEEGHQWIRTAENVMN